MSHPAEQPAPFFSVVIPTYNRAYLLPATLHSLAQQQFTDFEVLLVDDGSTDNTRQVVAELSQHHPWLRYLPKTNGERGAARNHGSRNALGQYVTFLDSDDKLYPQHLKLAHQTLLSKQRPPWYAQNYEYINGEGQKVRNNRRYKGDMNQRLIRGNDLSCMGVFLRKDLATQYFFDEDRRMTAGEDWELWLRVAVDHPLAYANHITGAMVEHDARSVLSLSAEELIARKQLMMEKVLNNPKITRHYSPADLRTFRASNYSFIALHIVLTGENKAIARTYLQKALQEDPFFLYYFGRRSQAILRRLL